MNNAKRDSEEVIEIIKKCDNNEMLINYNIELCNKKIELNNNPKNIQVNIYLQELLTFYIEYKRTMLK